MRRQIPAVRIFPMSDQRPGFRGRSIEQVQDRCFLRDLPATAGRWRYATTGLNADRGTIVLFQFRARIIASATFLRDEKFDPPRATSRGQIFFDPASLRTFDPVDAVAMRKAWPAFRAFGHVRQFLNPTRYPQFKRRLRNVAEPPSAQARVDKQA